jgi:hypothetical protein
VECINRIPSSFRDRSGFLYHKNGVLYRQVQTTYKDSYEHLMNSGLYDALVDADLLIPHKEQSVQCLASSGLYKTIKPEVIPFVSYPYEWCFSQLKDAALTTLRIQTMAMEFGMSLKDASAYNIQFKDGKPVLVDTLSFERYVEGFPWVAYRQFCQHFLAPLALISYKDARLSQLPILYIDGIPVDFASRLLPYRTRLVPALFMHIHLHARSQRHFAGKTWSPPEGKMSFLSFRGLVDSLESAVRKLKWTPEGGSWGDYYSDIHYSAEAFEDKRRVVAEFLDRINAKAVWDLGSNAGLFGRIAGDKGIFTVCLDADHNVVETCYLECKQKGEKNLFPLRIDLVNPTPAIGWENQERMSLLERGQGDTVMALALIHHLAISNNVPLSRLAEFFVRLCSNLIIEFVPKQDPKVQQLLSGRSDVFQDYSRRAFENEFSRHFKIVSSACIRDSTRILYLMCRHQDRGRQ